MGVSKLMQKNISTTYYNINVFKYAFCFKKSVCGFFFARLILKPYLNLATLIGCENTKI